MSKSKKIPMGKQTSGPGGHTLEMEKSGKDLFILFDGVRIAKREGGKWVSLDPRYEVRDLQGGRAIEVLRDGVTLH